MPHLTRRLSRRARHALGRRLHAVGERIAPGATPQPTFKYELHATHDGRLEDRYAIVTGGGGAIGSAICYRLAVEGCRVGVAGRTLATIEATVQQIVDAGVPQDRIMPLVMDVTDEASVSSAIDSFVGHNGRLDILVNNAGGGARGRMLPVEDQAMSVVREIIEVNLLGTFQCCKYSIAHLKHSRGRIVNIGSSVGHGGLRRYAEYAASKSGLIGLTKSLALELGDHGTTVNTVSPGPVWQQSFDGDRLRESPKTALGRRGRADEVASAVAYLCSDEGAFVTGVDLLVDGGRTLGLFSE